MKDNLNFIINHAKLSGLIYKSSELYNGIKAIYDYGPYGVEIKNNIKKLWWYFMVKLRSNVVGIDTSILMNNKVWESSGHVENFNEYFIKIKNKIYNFKLFIIFILKKIKNKKKIFKEFFKLLIRNKLKKIKNIINNKLINNNLKIIIKNFMFKININSFKKKQYTYLRPETAQGIFVNFKNVINSTRLKLPFGIAQIGKSFRNEIISKEFIFRTKEFEQMEMQYFVYPGKEKKWFKYWIKNRLIWHNLLNLGNFNYRLKKHYNLSHYTTYAIDIEFKYINNYKELEGIHFRKDFDLKNHQKKSKKKLLIYNNDKKKSILPYVIETSLGLDRLFYSILCKSIIIDKNKRIYLKLPNIISPIKIAILPLINNNKKIIKISKNIFNNLKFKYNIIYDEKNSIGKRYRLQDYIGTPYCITVDKLTIINKTVTIRFRDNMKQIRYNIKSLKKFFKKKFNISYFLKKKIKNV